VRICDLPPGSDSDQSDGVYGAINGSCIFSESFPLLSPLFYAFNTSSTTPSLGPFALTNPPTVNAYDTYAIISWVSPGNATLFNTYFLQAGLQIAINNGQGLLLTNPTITAVDLGILQTYTVAVFSGNGGGFEKLGSRVTFTTNIPVPSGVGIGSVGNTAVNLTWASNSYAQWYRVEYYETSNSKRSSSASSESTPTVFATKLSGTSVDITGLTPGTNYAVHIYAGMGDSYYEPHGTVTTVRTLAGGEFLLIPLPFFLNVY